MEPTEEPTEEYDMYIGANSRFVEEDGLVYFNTYIPPSRDDFSHLPLHIIYVVVAVAVTCGVLYAIIGHLMKDLVHDILDMTLGPEPEEVKVNLCEAKDKFQEDWCPETSAEIIEMVRQEEIKVGLDDDISPIWTISGGVNPRDARRSIGPHVAFGKVHILHT